MGHYYQSEREIEAVVQGFESCTTGVDDFKHRGHLTVAVWYLRNSTPEQAFQKMCSGLLRFLDHHSVGRTKYDERLTMKWIRLIQDAIEGMNPGLSLLEVTNIVIERLGDSRAELGNFGEHVGPPKVLTGFGLRHPVCWFDHAENVIDGT